MSDKSLEDIFHNQYPKLAEELKAIGITKLSLINQKVFNGNQMYFSDILGYSIQDNERIKNILRKENTEDVLQAFVISSIESRFGSDSIKAILVLAVIFSLIIILVYLFFKIVI